MKIKAGIDPPFYYKPWITPLEAVKAWWYRERPVRQIKWERGDNEFQLSRFFFRLHIFTPRTSVMLHWQRDPDPPARTQMGVGWPR